MGTCMLLMISLDSEHQKMDFEQVLINDRIEVDKILLIDSIYVASVVSSAWQRHSISNNLNSRIIRMNLFDGFCAVV